MKFQIKSSLTTNIDNLTTDCLVCTVSALSKLKISKHTLEYLKAIIKQEELDLESNINKSVLLFNIPNLTATRLLLISSGKEHKLSEQQFLTMLKNIYSRLSKHNIHNAVLCLNNLNINNRKFNWEFYQTITSLYNNSYSFNKYKSKKANQSNKSDLKTKPENKITAVDFIVNAKELTIAQSTLSYAMAVSNACKFTKDLANTPPNVCTPTYVATSATNLSKTSSKVKLTILEKKDLEKLNMGAFLSVTQGSPQPPKLVCIEYNGNKKHNSQPVVFIGKGITFDTGGNSLKPANSMIGMKYDMCGAATVLGLINFAIETNLNLNIVGILALAENMPGGNASRPEDVVTTMSGITVEILNTDAEGRLVLCEALTYCKKFNPKVVIDIATLTGACVVALGQHYTGLFSNKQELANQLLKAGSTVGDKTWQLPLGEEFHKQLESNIADVANIGGSNAGSITAACFLEKFAEDYTWAHLDVAGTATSVEGKFHHATGRPVPLLAQYLMDQANHPLD